MPRLAAVLILMTACTPEVAPVPPVPSTAFGFMDLLVGTWEVRYADADPPGRAEVFRVSAAAVDATFTRAGDAEVVRFTTDAPPGRWTDRSGSDLTGQPRIPESTYCPRTLGIWAPCGSGGSNAPGGPSVQVVTGDSVVFWTVHGVTPSMTLSRVR